GAQASYRGHYPVTHATADPGQGVAHAEAAPVMPPGRLGPRWWNYLKALFGVPHQRRLARAALYVDRIRHWEAEFGKLNDADLRLRGLQLRGRARGGESLDRLAPGAVGLVCVSAVRTIQLRPLHLHIAAGVILH